MIYFLLQEFLERLVDLANLAKKGHLVQLDLKESLESLELQACQDFLAKEGCLACQ